VELIAGASAKFVPVVGWMVAGYQAYKATTAAVQQYKTTFDQCMGD
jgi:hypothetical protein